MDEEPWVDPDSWAATLLDEAVLLLARLEVIDGMRAPEGLAELIEQEYAIGPAIDEYRMFVEDIPGYESLLSHITTRGSLLLDMSATRYRTSIQSARVREEVLAHFTQFRSTQDDTRDDLMVVAGVSEESVLSSAYVSLAQIVVVQHAVSDGVLTHVVRMPLWLTRVLSESHNIPMEVVFDDSVTDEQLETTAALWVPFETGGLYDDFATALSAARRLS